MNSAELLAFVLHNLEEMKAQDIVTLDVHSLTQITDSMVICSGTSSRHTQSIANSLVSHSKAQGVMPIGVEGEDYGDWILVDLGDVIIHVMLPPTREFYSLEKLWKSPEK